MGFGCVLGSFRVFMPCMVQQMLYIGNAWRGKTPRTWHFWNIKIPKPPCISSLKIIGLLHFWKVLGPSKANSNPQSLCITLYLLLTGPSNSTMYNTIAKKRKLAPSPDCPPRCSWSDKRASPWTQSGRSCWSPRCPRTPLGRTSKSLHKKICYNSCQFINLYCYGIFIKGQIAKISFSASALRSSELDHPS